MIVKKDIYGKRNTRAKCARWIRGSPSSVNTALFCGHSHHYILNRKGIVQQQRNKVQINRNQQK